jgi:hypothetical protein
MLKLKEWEVETNPCFAYIHCSRFSVILMKTLSSPLMLRVPLESWLLEVKIWEVTKYKHHKLGCPQGPGRKRECQPSLSEPGEAGTLCPMSRSQWLLSFSELVLCCNTDLRFPELPNVQEKLGFFIMSAPTRHGFFLFVWPQCLKEVWYTLTPQNVSVEWMHGEKSVSKLHFLRKCPGILMLTNRFLFCYGLMNHTLTTHSCVAQTNLS